MKINRKEPFAHTVHGILFSFITVLLSACIDNENDNYIDQAIRVEGPISGTPTLISTFFSLENQGYEQAEYFVSGTARSYANVSALESNGRWQVVAAEEGVYQTRIVVYRPKDPADFNGTVVVEWLNVSAGFDTAPDWGMAHTEFLRRGYAWVGVSAQLGGVDDLIDKAADRYDTLVHPGDSFSYDIYLQIGQVIREPGRTSPLGDLSPEYVIAAGESQSATRLMTYVNALGPSETVYDGYFIHSRLGGSAELSQNPQELISTPDVVVVRDDLQKPVMMLQTETDLFILDSYSSRQEDSAHFRLWEVAGTAHADLYTYLDNRADVGTNPAMAAVVENAKPVPLPDYPACDKPVNAGPQHFVVNAAFAALNKWIADGTEPTMADRLAVTGDPAAFVLDSLGNVEGGVRTPYVDAPIAVLSGEGQSGDGFCIISGTTELLDAAALSALYADNEAYITAVNTTTDNAVADGFLVPADGELMKTYAAESDIFSP